MCILIYIPDLSHLLEVLIYGLYLNDTPENLTNSWEVSILSNVASLKIFKVKFLITMTNFSKKFTNHVGCRTRPFEQGQGGASRVFPELACPSSASLSSQWGKICIHIVTWENIPNTRSTVPDIPYIHIKHYLSVLLYYNHCHYCYESSRWKHRISRDV